MNNYFAFQTRYSEFIHVKPHNYDEVFEALKSPSVVWVLRHFEEINFDAARSEAERRKKLGHGEKTFLGIELEDADHGK